MSLCVRGCACVGVGVRLPTLSQVTGRQVCVWHLDWPWSHTHVVQAFFCHCSPCCQETHRYTHLDTQTMSSYTHTNTLLHITGCLQETQSSFESSGCHLCGNMEQDAEAVWRAHTNGHRHIHSLLSGAYSSYKKSA